MSSRTQLKGAKKNRGKHSKDGRRGGSRPQLHPDEPFIKPLHKEPPAHTHTHAHAHKDKGEEPESP